MKLQTKTRANIIWNNVKLPLFAIVLLLILYNSKLQKSIGTTMNQYMDFKDPGFAGIFGALAGALVGGVMTLLVSLYVDNKQTKSKAILIKKNIIYTPLYNELISVQNILLNDNPYPSFFSLNIGHQTMIPHPQFNAWTRIKSDTRYLQVPKNLKETLDSFESMIENYGGYYNIATQELTNEMHRIFNDDFSATCLLRNLGQGVMRNFLAENITIENLKSHTERSIADKVQISDEQYEILIEKTYQFIKSNNEIGLYIRHYEKIITCLEDLIITLSMIIEAVSKKYESSKDFI